MERGGRKWFSLPTGLTLSPGGVLSGNPTTAGTYNFEVMATSGPPGGPATNISGRSGNWSVTISLVPLVITSTTVPDAVVGTPYADTLQVAGGTGVYSWTLVSGSLPGLTFYGDGIISGTAVTAGSYTIVVQVTSGTQTATQSLNVTITASIPLAITRVGAAGGQTCSSIRRDVEDTRRHGPFYAWSR